jgi:hypothetical protein
MDELKRQLEEIGFAVDESFRQQGVMVIKDFGVFVGRHASKVIDVGISCPDFPFSAPAGIHLKPVLAPNGANNIQASPLGTDWQYWSRRLPDWETDRSARHIISYINKVLLNAQ